MFVHKMCLYLKDLTVHQNTIVATTKLSSRADQLPQLQDEYHAKPLTLITLPFFGMIL